MLLRAYHVSLEAPEFRSAQKWSERMSRTFRRQGKRWDDRVEAEVKRRVAELVVEHPERTLAAMRRPLVDALARSLETRLQEVPEQ